jgi:hypothetical protein
MLADPDRACHGTRRQRRAGDRAGETSGTLHTAGNSPESWTVDISAVAVTIHAAFVAGISIAIWIAGAIRPGFGEVTDDDAMIYRLTDITDVRITRVPADVISAAAKVAERVCRVGADRAALHGVGEF